jgi:AcrR family transcriptional regulator
VSRREQNKLEKRERIRAAAFASFLKEGYEQTTVALIAERAKVAKGTIFLYASDKDDLLCMVMHERLSATVERALTTLSRKARLAEQLVHVFGVLFRMYAEHPELAVRFIQVLPLARGPNAQRMNATTFAFQHQLADLIKAAAARGEIARELPFALAAQNVFALYFGALTAWLNGYLASHEQALSVLRASIELQIRGFR